MKMTMVNSGLKGLILTVQIYMYMKYRDRKDFHFENIINIAVISYCFVSSFLPFYRLKTIIAILVAIMCRDRV